MLLFSTRSYAYLADQLCAGGTFERGRVEVSEFPDGERYQRILDDCDGRATVVVGGTISDSDTLEVYDLAYHLAGSGARSLVMVIPYFGYSTMERAVKPGEVVTAKSRARLLSAVPDSGCSNTVVLIDLHTDGLQHYFEGSLRRVHLYAKPAVLDAVRDVGGSDFVLACTDAGRAKWVESLANDLGTRAAFVFKRRLSGREVEVTAVRAQVEGQRVVIYDDMIRTGGSLLSAARAYREAGAASVAAVATHALFPGNALERLRESGLLDRLAVTDTHPRARELEDDYLTVYPIAPVVAGYLAAR